MWFVSVFFNTISIHGSGDCFLIPKFNAIESWMKSPRGRKVIPCLLLTAFFCNHHAPCLSNLPIYRESSSQGSPQLCPKGEFVCPALSDPPQPRENQNILCYSWGWTVCPTPSWLEYFGCLLHHNFIKGGKKPHLYLSKGPQQPVFFLFLLLPK